MAVGLAAVLVGMSGRLREPLGEQVSIAERPRPATTASLFLSVLVLMAAVVATYRATVVTATDPGWVVLAAPALVGLAVGQLTVWLIRLGAGLAVRRTASAGLPTFLAARRLARVARAADPIRLLVAAAVVAAISITAALQVTDWTRDTARIRAAAPYRVDVDGDVTEALALAAELDPDGRWLMAAAVVPGEGSVPARRGFVDTARYDAVVGDFLAGTPAAAASARVSELVPDDRVARATGDTLRVAVRGVSRRLEGTLRPRRDRGLPGRAGASRPSGPPTSRSARDGAPVTTTIPVAPCTAGCTLTQITLRRGPGDAPLPYVVTRLEFAGVDALAGEWRSTERAQSGETTRPGRGGRRPDDGGRATQPAGRPRRGRSGDPDPGDRQRHLGRVRRCWTLPAATSGRPRWSAAGRRCRSWRPTGCSPTCPRPRPGPCPPCPPPR